MTINKYLVNTIVQLIEFTEELDDTCICAFDTETTGLNIIQDTPFLFIAGYYKPSTDTLNLCLIDERHCFDDTFADLIESYLWKIPKNVPNLAHNIKFDLNMIDNIGVRFQGGNFEDTLWYIRYAHYALTEENGGPPMRLKPYIKKYIDPNFANSEKELQTWKTQKAKEYNNGLIQKGLKIKDMQEFFKDSTATPKDMEFEKHQMYISWFSSLPPLIRRNLYGIYGLVKGDDIPYNMIPEEILYKYAFNDVIGCILIYLKNKSIVAEKNQIGFDIDKSNLEVCLEEERTGFTIDKKYLLDCTIKTKTYLKECRKELIRIFEQPISIGQHKTLKELFLKKYNLNLNSTSNENLQLTADKLQMILNDIDGPDLGTDFDNLAKASHAIELITELRTLEKWFSVYMVRFINRLDVENKIYTQINLTGTVSGRISSDFQQFPKNDCTTKDGQVLFKPRQMVLVPPGYKAMVYIDYSQIELRVTALYTILCGNPDLNLCRAYMPYKCKSATGIEFDYNNPAHIRNYAQYEWFLEEDNSKWTPTDIHGATTTIATGLKPGDPEFKKARSEVGKRTNFAKNYGACYNKIRSMFPHKTEAECHAIDEAYYKAFPGIKVYHQYCQAILNEQGYASNLQGVNYYGVDAHKLKNLLVQGSSAYMLKQKKVEVYNYMKAHNMQSKLQIDIHDELAFLVHPSDSVNHWWRIKNIMEDFGLLIPIVAEVAVTKTNWAEKKDIHSEEELLQILNG